MKKDKHGKEASFMGGVGIVITSWRDEWWEIL